MKNSLRFEILRRDGFTCRYCGARAPEAVLNVDHVVPIAKGGKDDPLNLVTACFECNHGKFTKRLDDTSLLEGQTVEGERQRVERDRALIKAYIAENKALEKETQAVIKKLVKLWGGLAPRRSYTIDTNTISRMLATYSPTVIEQGIRSIAAKVEGGYVRNGALGARQYLWGTLRNIRDGNGERPENEALRLTDVGSVWCKTDACSMCTWPACSHDCHAKGRAR